MSLTLRAVLLDDRPLSRPIEACFGREGGTIGRADENTLALPDPLRYISRRQARISFTAAGFVIENIGSANPIAVRGEPLPQGHCAPLRHHDQLRIGAYVLEAVEVPDEGEAVPAASLAVPAEVPTMRAADGAAAADAGLWEAFCEGAGLGFEADPGTTAACLRAAGQVLRHVAAGLLELMCVQSLPARGLPCGVDTNALSNPLKVAPDTQAVLEMLLLPALPGFLDGPQAVAQALQELTAQAVATGAGTRAARDGVLRRFAPPALEARLHAAAPQWWPVQRRARLWVQYGLLFEHLRDQAQVDFDTLFGQAFALAYAEQLQLQRLRRDRAC